MNATQKGLSKNVTAVRRRLAREYASQVKRGEKGGWRAVGARNDVSGATAHAVATRGYDPHRPDIRRALGLPILAPGRGCPVHGVVHDRMCRAQRAATSPRPRFNRRAVAVALLGALVTR